MNLPKERYLGSLKALIPDRRLPMTASSNIVIYGAIWVLFPYTMALTFCLAIGHSPHFMNETACLRSLAPNLCKMVWT